MQFLPVAVELVFRFESNKTMGQIEIATFNVNGIRARLKNLLDWMSENKPDVVLLQEIKCVTESFPKEAIEDLGYNIALKGEKGFNGVAVLSKFPIEDVILELPGDTSDKQARWLECYIKSIKICNVYLPNGNPIGTTKYEYKLKWIERLTERLRELRLLEEPVVVLGDFNVIPTKTDCHDPNSWLHDAIFQPEVRRAFQKLLNLGYTDSLKMFCLKEKIYTYWDYQRRSWENNFGIRIDHCLLSPQAADKLQGIKIYSSVRQLEKPSDHVPVSITLSG